MNHNPKLNLPDVPLNKNTISPSVELAVDDALYAACCWRTLANAVENLQKDARRYKVTNEIAFLKHVLESVTRTVAAIPPSEYSQVFIGLGLPEISEDIS